MGWWLGGGLPVIAMLALNVVAAVLVSLVKVAMDGGLNPLVLVTLQQLTAAIFLGPIAYFKERCSSMACIYTSWTWIIQQFSAVTALLNCAHAGSPGQSSHWRSSLISSSVLRSGTNSIHTNFASSLIFFFFCSWRKNKFISRRKNKFMALLSCSSLLFLQGSSKAVHDLRCFEIHHGDLRHCLLQYRSCPHILACHPNTVGSWLEDPINSELLHTRCQPFSLYLLLAN